MRYITVLTIIAILAVGTAGMITGLTSAPTVEAKSCNQFDDFECNGCAPKTQGHFSSKGKCFHS
jgi:hypothetical protein